MSQMSRARTVLALFAIALGGFAIGCTEFSTMGILPQIAADLVPSFDAQREQAIADAGWLVTGYALGVVVGAPTIAVFGSRMSQSRLALILLAALALTNALSAVAPEFATTMIARFLAGLPHGAYFGVASLLAGRIMGPGKQGIGISIALSGLTIANIFGVPLGTWLGQAAGWRWAYLAVAVIFLVAMALAWISLPRLEGNPHRNPVDELQAYRRWPFLLMVLVGAIGFAGFFAVYSYIADIATLGVGLEASTVPWLLACVGVGMTIGNFVGGWLSDRFPRGSIVVGFIALLIMFVVFALFANTPVTLFVLTPLVAATSSTLTPAVQTRLINLAGDAPLIGAATNHAAFNIGNSIGAWSGGLVIASGFGYFAPGWVGFALAAVGFALVLLSLGGDRGETSTAELVKTGPIVLPVEADERAL
ncbi:MFS transporter [Gulosibacter faecalis]|jgi:DHA1 family inner membrane transport protein|uniref:MFS transporter n=1 Tax=Gulosibacter faecalis TaxID=272240 RepID=A0ABW5UYF9_9MICO|nr:MFS transporter [Gulosibacter faecalis]